MEFTDNQNIELLKVLSARPLVSAVDSETLFVEPDEVKKIQLAIETNENVLIIGERGGGKTSLINHIYNIYNNTKEDRKIVPIRFNALLIGDFTTTNFLKALMDNIFDSIMNFRTKGEKLWSILEKTMGASNKDYSSFPIALEGNIRYGEKNADFEVLTNRLERIVHTLRNRKVEIFVLLDDTDKFHPNIVWNTFRGIRDMLWDLRVSFILTSLPDQVSELTRPPLDQFFPYWIKLKPFDEKMTKELLDKRNKYAHTQIRLNDDTLKQIVTQTRGNPRTILSMMKNIIESGKYGNPITTDDIERLGLPYSFDLSKIKRDTINYLAANPNVSASDEDFIEKMNLTRNRIVQILHELQEKGLIGSKKEGKKIVYFITKKGIIDKIKSEEKNS